MRSSTEREPLRRSARRRQRGSIYIELIGLLPLLVTIWVVMIYVDRVNRGRLVAQSDTRECAWSYTWRSCPVDYMPAACSRGSNDWYETVTTVDDNEIEGRSGGAFSDIAGGLGFLDATLQTLHGDLFDVAHTRGVPKPSPLTGERIVTGRYSTMCNTITREWNTEQVFRQTCDELLGIWCP
jgi:hypothetical protein